MLLFWDKDHFRSFVLLTGSMIVAFLAVFVGIKRFDLVWQWWYAALPFVGWFVSALLATGLYRLAFPQSYFGKGPYHIEFFGRASDVFEWLSVPCFGAGIGAVAATLLNMI